MKTRESPVAPLRKLVAGLAVVAVAAGCDAAPAGGEPGASAESAAADSAALAADAYLRPTDRRPELTSGDTIRGHPSWTEQDWRVLDETVRWAKANAVDTLAIGERMAAIGEHWVGTPYVPQTLDPPGPERLVVNLRALDCVTFVENVMATAHLLAATSPRIPEDRDLTIRLYEDILTSIRYRGGVADGYASRLHYFTEWLWDNANKGYIELVTEDLGGLPDPEPIDFMTSHRDSYHQLSDPEVFEAIRRIESQLSDRPRHYVPEAEVASVQTSIETGDIIAATSTLEGLDVAHTGIAVWKDGVLRLLHAPLVGDSVEISERPLVERLQALEGQDGIKVGRPHEGGAARIMGPADPDLN